MHEEIIARAEFLLTELRLSPGEAQTQLRYWFPELELEERARYIRTAARRATPPGGGEPREQPCSAVDSSG
ncbi:MULTISPECIES: hypothetical protein [Kitasatospora]|uniref:Uncharacterized protein n=1 Tax=Kitasatospora cystarginea TaxID=58350 RepID=A0ABN3DCI2_9ACTN